MRSNFLVIVTAILGMVCTISLIYLASNDLNVSKPKVIYKEVCHDDE